MADYGLSVRKGEAGKPSLLYRLAPSGLSAQEYLTYNGAGTPSFQNSTLSALITALAQTNFLSAPAMANCESSPPSLTTSPAPKFLKEISILFSSIFAD